MHIIDLTHGYFFGSLILNLINFPELNCVSEKVFWNSEIII